MNVLFVINTMQGGGAARVTAVLANQLVANGFKVGIATNLSSKSCSYQLNPSIQLINIYGKRNFISFSITRLIDHSCRLMMVLSKFKPNIIIGEQEDGILFSKIATIFSKIPIIGHRHNTFKILGLSKIQELIYNSVEKSVFLHNTDVEFVGNKIKNSTFIYNPCSYPTIEIKQREKKKIIVAVGSTKRYINKGFDILLDIWCRIAMKYPDWSLHIIGGGSVINERLLKDKVDNWGITDQVVFTGNVDDVDRRLKEASIFLLPSRVEGFPMVINEAISQGCACVSFSLQGVMNELFSSDAIMIVNDGNTEYFSECIERLINNIDLRDCMVAQSQIEVDRYMPEKIVRQWIELIMDVYRKYNYEK